MLLHWPTELFACGGSGLEEILQGKYRILHEVGQGGMAVVYRGVDTSLEREVAVKVLHPHLASRADSRMRFHREAKAVAKLHHPNILEIYDYSGLDSERSYIITEYIRGETLKDFTSRQAPTLPEVGAMVVHQIAAALAHAHHTGIIHRDIKPENIMIREDGVLKLMDFGIAQIVGTDAMTVTGALVGSPAHMSPEHVEGRTLDFRADIFSLGTLLYFLCAGRLPFDSASPHALLRQILEAQYDDPRRHNPAIGRRLAEIITTCLQRDPDDRYPSVDHLQYDLSEYLNQLGMEDPAEELRVYFEDPAVAEADLTRRVVERLMGRAREDAGTGRVAAALEAYNQVLALEGDRADALSQIQRLSSARSRARLLRLGAAAVAAVSLVAGIAWLGVPGASGVVPTPRLDMHVAAVPEAALRPAPVAVAPATPRGPATAGAIAASAAMRPVGMRPREPVVRQTRRVGAPDPPDVARVRLGVADARRPRLGLVLTTPWLERRKAKERKERERKRALADGRSTHREAIKPSGPTSRPMAAMFSFTVKAYPPAAQIEFKGQTYASRTPILNLPAGQYAFWVRHPECPECARTRCLYNVDARDPPRRELECRIGFKRAALTVQSEPGARFNAEGHRGTSGATVELKIARRGGRTVKVTVTKKGFQRAERWVPVKPGQSHTVRIPLTPLAPTPPL